jgi:hypothetical protein
VDIVELIKAANHVKKVYVTSLSSFVVSLMILVGYNKLVLHGILDKEVKPPKTGSVQKTQT